MLLEIKPIKNLIFFGREDRFHRKESSDVGVQNRLIVTNPNVRGIKSLLKLKRS